MVGELCTVLVSYLLLIFRDTGLKHCCLGGCGFQCCFDCATRLLWCLLAFRVCLLTMCLLFGDYLLQLRLYMERFGDYLFMGALLVDVLVGEIVLDVVYRSLLI